ncbi:uncharacterized protein TNCV_3761251 [Trichonephila clavipes]|nr:uncharacterized protein TNCV_3761251 [Trichonephila clavipes]
MCPKRLYTVCLETVVPVAEESWRDRSDVCAPSVSFGSNGQIPALIQRCNSETTCVVTSNHITIILETLLKPGDDTLDDSKFLEYFQLGTSAFQSSNNSTP